MENIRISPADPSVSCKNCSGLSDLRTPHKHFYASKFRTLLASLLIVSMAALSAAAQAGITYNGVPIEEDEAIAALMANLTRNPLPPEEPSDKELGKTTKPQMRPLEVLYQTLEEKGINPLNLKYVPDGEEIQISSFRQALKRLKKLGGIGYEIVAGVFVPTGMLLVTRLGADVALNLVPWVVGTSWNIMQAGSRGHTLARISEMVGSFESWAQVGFNPLLHFRPFGPKGRPTAAINKLKIFQEANDGLLKPSPRLSNVLGLLEQVTEELESLSGSDSEDDLLDPRPPLSSLLAMSTMATHSTESDGEEGFSSSKETVEQQLEEDANDLAWGTGSMSSLSTERAEDATLLFPMFQEQEGTTTGALLNLYTPDAPDTPLLPPTTDTHSTTALAGDSGSDTDFVMEEEEFDGFVLVDVARPQNVPQIVEYFMERGLIRRDVLRVGGPGTKLHPTLTDKAIWVAWQTATLSRLIAEPLAFQYISSFLGQVALGLFHNSLTNYFANSAVSSIAQKCEPLTEKCPLIIYPVLETTRVIAKGDAYRYFREYGEVMTHFSPTVFQIIKNPIVRVRASMDEEEQEG